MLDDGRAHRDQAPVPRSTTVCLVWEGEHVEVFRDEDAAGAFIVVQRAIEATRPGFPGNYRIEEREVRE